MRIAKEIPYDGVRQRIARLNLSPLVEEVRRALESVRLQLKKEPGAERPGFLQKLIDARFQRASGWSRAIKGRRYWKKCVEIDGASVCAKVGVRVSGRKDFVVTDLHSLCRSIETGEVDLGILVVPSDRLSHALRPRQTSLRETQEVVEQTNACSLPLLLIAIEYDRHRPVQKV